MNKHEWLQVLEFWYGKVSWSSCLAALLALNSHADIRRLNHIYVIRSIADCHCNNVFIIHFDHLDNVCFLLGSHTACNNHIKSHTNREKALHLTNQCQTISRDHKCMFLFILTSLIIQTQFYFLNLFQSSFILTVIKSVNNGLIVVDYAGRYGNVHSCL